MPTALVRGVASTLAECELTHLTRAPIDVDVARRQHAAYADVLRVLGLHVLEVPADDAHPDCVFIEDTAVAVGPVAVIARAGAESRRGEVAPVASALLRQGKRLVGMEAPATLDGGDVLVVGADVYVGRTARTNDAGIEALSRALAPLGKTVRAVDVTGCLHLKTACTHVGGGALLVNPAFVAPAAFEHGDGRRFIEVHPDEPAAANALLVGDVVVYPREHERTGARLGAQGVRVVPVDNSELAKAEGGVTCCALLA